MNSFRSGQAHQCDKNNIDAILGELENNNIKQQPNNITQQQH